MLLFRLQTSATPQFSTADNPTARNPYFLTRLLTFAYLPVFNFGLLLYPNTLSFDWGMEAVPRITSLRDPRNLLMVLFYALAYAVTKKCVSKIHLMEETKVGRSVARRKTCRELYVLSEEKAVLCQCPVCHQSLSDVHSASCRNSNNNNSVSLHSTCVCAKLKAPRVFRRATTRQKRSGSASAIVLSLAFLALPFLPATNLLFYVGFVVAERVLYLPSAGLCLLLGLGCEKLWDSRKYRRTSLACLFVLLCVFSARTLVRNKDWMSEEALFRSALHVNPPKGKIYSRVLTGSLLYVCRFRVRYLECKVCCDWFFWKYIIYGRIELFEVNVKLVVSADVAMFIAFL